MVVCFVGVGVGFFVVLADFLFFRVSLWSAGRFVFSFPSFLCWWGCFWCWWGAGGGGGPPPDPLEGPHEPDLALHVEDLTVSYHGKPALWDIDINLPPGVMAAVVGPNGAGKSTLIKAIIDLVKPVAGHVCIHGRRYREQRRRVGYVPQRSSVDWDFPTTALDVVMMGLYGQLGWLRRPGRRARERAMAALAEVRIADLAQRQISQLSGGQQQRVFLARALVQEADLYFLDEPMAGVDATTERTVVDLLHKLRDAGKTIVVVHHDLQTVQDYFNWIVILNVRLIAQGPVREVYTPENLHKAYGGPAALLQRGSFTGERGPHAPMDIGS